MSSFNDRSIKDVRLPETVPVTVRGRGDIHQPCHRVYRAGAISSPDALMPGGKLSKLCCPGSGRASERRHPGSSLASIRRRPGCQSVGNRALYAGLPGG